MKPNPIFLNQTNEFWALSKYISETLGYSKRFGARVRTIEGTLMRYTRESTQNINDQFVIDPDILKSALDYLNYRATALETNVTPLLMDRNEAHRVFKKLCKGYKAKCALPMNKQKGDKRHYNYLTCIINILTERNLKSGFDDSPRGLCAFTDKNNRLVKVLSRWMDGAYPEILNPVAVWEVKEYYGTTTFGSRVADGVYESQLDGYEILEAKKASGQDIQHYLFVDDKFTWWKCGKSYLCRLIDMMHMGLVDEVIFGREVLTRWPEIVKSWKK